MTQDGSEGARIEAESAALAWFPLRCVRRAALDGFDAPVYAAAFAAQGVETASLDAASSESFDAVFLDLRGRDQTGASARIELALGVLGPFGALYMVLPKPLRGIQVLGELFGNASLIAYGFWELAAEGQLHFIDEPDAFRLAENWLAMGVRAAYDPLAHARALFAAGHPGWSMEVLENVPQPLLTSDEARGLIYAEKMLCMLQYDKEMGPDGRLNRFSKSQDDFFKGTTFLPRCAQAYRYRALFWNRIGRSDLAHATLRSLLHVMDDAPGRTLLDALPPPQAPEPPIEILPPWQGRRTLRLLYVMHAHSDYGADVLYDGICAVQGDDSIVEYPYKPTLHGRNLDGAFGYPCTFNRGGGEQPLREILDALRAGRFDAMLYSDTFRSLDMTEVRSITAAALAGETPIFVVDTWDQCGDYFGDIEAHIGSPPVRARFKREMLTGIAYRPETYPLVFGYPDDRVPEKVDFENREGCFWAGKPQFGMRRFILEWLHERLGFVHDRTYSQEEYVQAVRHARLGLSLFGNGFDTVRYWELPAHGCMLLSERPPIRIPNNFIDGESAVFFDDVAELEEKLTFYLAHPDEARRIAEAGHAHFKRHHTGSQRAREFLGHLECILG